MSPMSVHISNLFSKQSIDLNVNQNNMESPIIMANLQMQNILGQGSYAIVKLYKDKITQQRYAVKVYDKQKLMAESQKINNLKREIQILQKIDHTSLIKLIQVSEDQKYYYLIMEYISSLSLQNYAKTKNKNQLNESECKHIFSQIMVAVAYLHQNQIAHRDIKPENILMITQSNIKLIDFGFAIFVDKECKSSVFCGTPNYMAPELLSNTPHNPYYADIWSCGILLYQLLCGELPFKAQNNKDLKIKIQNNQWKLIDDLNISQACIRVLKGCLEKNVNKRWSAAKILQDEWLNLKSYN